MNHTKVCTICQEKLPATREYFHKSKKGKLGLRQCCIECRKKEYIENKSYHSKKNKEYYQKNKTTILEQRIDYRNNNKKLITTMQQRWRSKNKQKILANNAKYVKQKRKKDIHFKILLNIRSRIGNAIKQNKKTQKTIVLLGCSMPELITHLEKKFTEGMSWKNHGRKGWHIDHIIPCSSFDLTDTEQQKKCFHYTNLQPLWAEDNLRKSNKIL
jgi:hypothetical protein